MRTGSPLREPGRPAAPALPGLARPRAPPPQDPPQGAPGRGLDGGEAARPGRHLPGGEELPRVPAPRAGGHGSRAAPRPRAGQGHRPPGGHAPPALQALRGGPPRRALPPGVGGRGSSPTPAPRPSSRRSPPVRTARSSPSARRAASPPTRPRPWCRGDSTRSRSVRARSAWTWRCRSRWPRRRWRCGGPTRVCVTRSRRNPHLDRPCSSGRVAPTPRFSGNCGPVAHTPVRARFQLAGGTVLAMSTRSHVPPPVVHAAVQPIVRSVAAGAPLTEVLRAVIDEANSVVGVLSSSGQLVGTISERDILRCLPPASSSRRGGAGVRAVPPASRGRRHGRHGRERRGGLGAPGAIRLPLPVLRVAR